MEIRKRIELPEGNKERSACLNNPPGHVDDVLYDRPDAAAQNFSLAYPRARDIGVLVFLDPMLTNDPEHVVSEHG